ncbi:hypothetical protein MCHI_001139 [Candidatus Magnetoovum chiemensis]|nr:hypothetical protein MCHI_001139 [Candidatus Magnetoovum chiemensis]
MKMPLPLTLLARLPLESDGYAQRGRGMGSGGWGCGYNFQRMYNPAAVTTVVGIVESIDQVVPFSGMSYGVHINLKTDKGIVSVHLGPAWYLDRQDLTINKGDKLEITGSMTTFNTGNALIASTVKKGYDVLTLRDQSGVPYWAGCRNRCF